MNKKIKDKLFFFNFLVFSKPGEKRVLSIFHLIFLSVCMGCSHSAAPFTLCIWMLTADDPPLTGSIVRAAPFTLCIGC